jgi:hypothetical protein
MWLFYSSFFIFQLFKQATYFIVHVFGFFYCCMRMTRRIVFSVRKDISRWTTRVENATELLVLDPLCSA